MTDNMDIVGNIKNLGLADNEALVYMEILESEKSILEISKSLNIPRTTVYRICEDLVDKQFAEWIIQDRGNLIRAVEPNQLGFLINKEEERINSLKSSLSFLQEMVKVSSDAVPKTQVRYYKGVKGLRQMLWNTLKAKEELVGYSEFGRVGVVGEKFYNKYVEEFNFRKLSDKVIGNEQCLEYYRKHILGNEPIKPTHQINKEGVRIIDEKTFYVSGDHAIYNDVYAISYWNQGEVVGVEIENKELVQMHKSIFEILWKIARPAEKY